MEKNTKKETKQSDKLIEQLQDYRVSFDFRHMINLIYLSIAQESTIKRKIYK